MNTHTCKKTECSFDFQGLPPEIRNHIYFYVLDPCHFILSSKQEKLSCISLETFTSSTVRNRGAIQNTSRLINEEASYILYHHSDFSFQEPAALRQFSAKLRSRTKAAIRAVSVHSYSEYTINLPLWEDWTDDVDGLKLNTQIRVPNQSVSSSLVLPFLDDWSAEVEELRAETEILCDAQVLLSLPEEIKGLAEELFPCARVELPYYWTGRHQLASRAYTIFAERSETSESCDQTHGVLPSSSNLVAD